MHACKKKTKMCLGITRMCLKKLLKAPVLLFYSGCS